MRKVNEDKVSNNFRILGKEDINDEENVIGKGKKSINQSTINQTNDFHLQTGFLKTFHYLNC